MCFFQYCSIFRNRKKSFFSRPFDENFKFLKKCPCDFHKILHSHYTPKGAPACAMASKLYDWDLRIIAKISPKMTKKQTFLYFFHFSEKLPIRTEFCTVVLQHIMVLCVPRHQNRMTGIGASQKEKDLARLLYRTCGCGLIIVSLP